MLKNRFPTILYNIMSTPLQAFTLYKDNEELKNKAIEVVNTIIAEHPEYVDPTSDTFAKKFLGCPEWAIKPYFIDPTIPYIVTEYKSVSASEIMEILLLNDKYEKIADASTQNASQAVREACLKTLKLFGNGRVFNYQNGEELTMVTNNLNNMLDSNLIDETTKNQILALGSEQVTHNKSWADQFNKVGEVGEIPDADKLFINGYAFDQEWAQLKLYWYPVN